MITWKCESVWKENPGVNVWESEALLCLGGSWSGEETISKVRDGERGRKENRRLPGREGKGLHASTFSISLNKSVQVTQEK